MGGSGPADGPERGRRAHAVGPGPEAITSPDREAIMPEAMLNGVDRDLRLTQVLDTFLAALHAGTPPEQSVLLAQHPDLAEELRECLASLAFIRQAAQPAEGSGEEPAPKELGDFRLVREIGRGGMGVVYEAQQLSLSRRVALKVLPFAATMDPRQLQRFHNEALAAAHLDHPHIVDVYGVGCERGVHFYAMRYVEGHALGEIIDQLRTLRGQEGAVLPDAVAAVQTRAEQPLPHPDERTGAYTPQPAASPALAETAI